MLLSDLLEDYHQHIKVELGLSKATTKSYISWTRHFHRWLEENGNSQPALEDFNAPTLKRYLYYLAAGKRRPRTIRGAIIPLRGFGQYLVDMGALKEDPCASLKLSKRDAAKRGLVSDDEARAVLAIQSGFVSTSPVLRQFLFQNLLQNRPDSSGTEALIHAGAVNLGKLLSCHPACPFPKKRRADSGPALFRVAA